MINNVRYQKVDDEGLHIRIDGTPRLLEVDNVIVCAGQVSERALEAPLTQNGARLHIIGGASEAAELDARRAFDQGVRLAANL